MLKNKKIDNLQLFSESQGCLPDIMSPTGSLLETMMIEMQRKGNLAEVQFALERSDETIKKYRNSFWRYRVLLPAPYMFIRAIKEQFLEEPDIKPLLKAFVYDKMEIKISIFIYLISLLLFLACLLSIGNISTFSTILIVLIIWLFCQTYVFEKIINESVFVPLYNKIRDALLRRIESQQQFIEDTIKLPEMVYKRYQEYEKTKIFDQLTISEKENFKQLDLEAAERLQGLSSTVAIYQATSEESIKKLRNETNLAYTKADLNIRDDIEEKNRLHQVAIAEINSLEKILVAQAQILGEDTKAERDVQREISRNLSLLRGWKSHLGNKGREGFQDISDNVKEEVKNISNKYKTTDD